MVVKLFVMRMWNISPEFLCNKHLLGEHVEMHMFFGTLNLCKRIDGYISNGLVEVHNIKRRHDELAQEMNKRGYSHKSPIQDSNVFFKAGFVDVTKSFEELQLRCTECRRKIQTIDKKF